MTVLRGSLLSMLTGVTPVLAAVDVAETVRFYTEVLGFTSSWVWGDPVVAGAATWGKVTLVFNLRPHLGTRFDGHEVSISVDDVDSLYLLHLERGVKILSEIEDKPWGLREYTVEDPNGYHLRFGGSLSHTSMGSGKFPDGIEILRRRPTAEEFAKVAEKAFYQDGVSPDIVENSWAGVVARDPVGGVIGVVRIMKDAPGWFSVWDVAVLPDWQGQRIGTAMLKAALEMVRDDYPGAFVYLFTHKQGFYERIGFDTGSVSIVKV